MRGVVQPQEDRTPAMRTSFLELFVTTKANSAFASRAIVAKSWLVFPNIFRAQSWAGHGAANSTTAIKAFRTERVMVAPR